MNARGWREVRNRTRTWAALDEERGQALVEFALIAPLLILLIVGVFELARAWQSYQVITDAAREGARVAVIDATPPVTLDSVQNTVLNALTLANLDPGLVDSLGIMGFHTGRGNPTEVYLSYTHNWIWLRPLLGWFGAAGSVTLKTNIIMRQE